MSEGEHYFQAVVDRILRLNPNPEHPTPAHLLDDFATSGPNSHLEGLMDAYGIIDPEVLPCAKCEYLLYVNETQGWIKHRMDWQNVIVSSGNRCHYVLAMRLACSGKRIDHLHRPRLLVIDFHDLILSRDIKEYW